MLTGGGWVPLGAAGINAIVSPWFVHQRPLALAKACNGASVGGMVFLPLWAVLIERVGFPAAAMMVGLVMVAVVMSIATRELARTPTSEDRPADASTCLAPAAATHPALWRDRRFLTLAAAMSMGLFAQIGLIAQLFALMAPDLGPRWAGGVMALATGCGMGGRLIMARLLGARVVARSVALSQALYAFAPAVLAGLMVGGSRAAPSWGVDTGACFFVIVALQVLAAGSVWTGRRPVRLQTGPGRTASAPNRGRPGAVPCGAPRTGGPGRPAVRRPARPPQG
jgi:hypothetical protein